METKPLGIVGLPFPSVYWLHCLTVKACPCSGLEVKTNSDWCRFSTNLSAAVWPSSCHHCETYTLRKQRKTIFLFAPPTFVLLKQYHFHNPRDIITFPGKVSYWSQSHHCESVLWVCLGRKPVCMSPAPPAPLPPFCFHYVLWSVLTWSGLLVQTCSLQGQNVSNHDVFSPWYLSLIAHPNVTMSST